MPYQSVFYIIRACVRCNQKERQECPVKGYNCGILPLMFPNLGHIGLHPSKQHVFLEILVDKKAFYFSKLLESFKKRELELLRRQTQNLHYNNFKKRSHKPDLIRALANV